MTPEQKKKLAEARARRGSETYGLDLRPVADAVQRGARNVTGRVLRVGDVALNTLGGIALTGSGLIGKAAGTKDARDLERARGAFMDVGKSAKAVLMGEPEGEDIVSNRVRHRGADADWARKEGKRKGGSVKKMAKGGSTASRRADGCARKGKTKGRFV